MSIQQLFDQHVSSEFLAEFGMALARLYDEAYSEAKAQVSLPEVGDTLPHLRRGMIEGEFRKLGRKFGLRARIPSNPKGNRHTQLHAGPIILTQSFVREEWGRVRQARFRNKLAQRNRLLFESEFEGGADKVYGILIHCADPEKKSLVSFYGIGFPAYSSDAWVERRNLTHMVREASTPTIEVDLPRTGVEQIPDQVPLTLRRADNRGSKEA